MPKTKSTKTPSAYTGITTLEGLMGVRSRLSMYIGSTGVLREGHMPRALTQMMQEVVSNAADEYLAGYGDIIDVSSLPDDNYTILITSSNNNQFEGEFTNY